MYCIYSVGIEHKTKILFLFNTFQLSPIERYAMRFVEETGGSWTEQLRCAEAEIEQQKREWEANRLAALRKEEEDAKRALEEEENQLLTYSGVDARNQVNNNKSKKSVNRSLVRNKSVTNNARRRQSEIVKSNRRQSRNQTPRRGSPQSKRKSLPATTIQSPKKRKIEETRPTRNRSITTTPRSIPKRSCRQTNNSRSETMTDNDNDNNDVSSDGGNASSNESKKATSESLVHSDDDSLDECSLDVMYDEQQSESNSVQAPSSSGVDNDKSDSSDNDSETAENGSEQNGKQCVSVLKSVSAEKRRESLTNRLDINSPRTRSRGTVKLNLWALDDSPILPSFGGRSKRNQNKPNDLHDKSVSETKNTRSRSNSPTDSTKKSNDKRSRSKSQSIERDESVISTSNRSRSNSLSNDLDGNATDTSTNHLAENEPIVCIKRCRSTSQDNVNQDSKLTTNTAITNDRRKTIAVIKLAQIKDGLDGCSKPLKAKRPPKKVVVKNGKSSSTLDSWLSSSKSAKIVLNKDDDAITKHLTEIATRTRRASTLKINVENNGPS